MHKQRVQQKIWEEEHANSLTLPSIHASQPSDNVVNLLDYFKQHALYPGTKVLDIGCGKGRNAIYLAEQGFEVYAFDYISYALTYAAQQAELKNVAHAIHFYQADMDSRWHFTDNFFDFSIDNFSSIDIETSEGRTVYKQELFRTLKPGGYALVCVVAADDEFEQQLMAEHPGAEKNSSVWPINNKFQKNYTHDELKEFYAEFTIIELSKITKKATKLGKEFIATNYWLLVQKP